VIVFVCECLLLQVSTPLNTLHGYPVPLAP
jgi:hypothetical protein